MHASPMGARYRRSREDYLTAPTRTLVISPDNDSRRDLNVMMHRGLQAAARSARRIDATRVLVGGDLTAPNAVGRRGTRRRHRPLHHREQGKAHRIREYGRVTAINVQKNKMRVRLDDRHGRSFRTVTYDPRRLKGVTVYREAERQFAVGDRVQFSAINKDLNVANRERGHIVAITPRPSRSISNIGRSPSRLPNGCISTTGMPSRATAAKARPRTGRSFTPTPR